MTHTSLPLNWHTRATEEEEDYDNYKYFEIKHLRILWKYISFIRMANAVSCHDECSDWCSQFSDKCLYSRITLNCENFCLCICIWVCLCDKPLQFLQRHEALNDMSSYLCFCISIIFLICIFEFDGMENTKSSFLYFSIWLIAVCRSWMFARGKRALGGKCKVSKAAFSVPTAFSAWPRKNLRIFFAVKNLFSSGTRGELACGQISG